MLVVLSSPYIVCVYVKCVCVYVCSSQCVDVQGVHASGAILVLVCHQVSLHQKDRVLSAVCQLPVQLNLSLDCIKKTVF